MVKLDLGSHRVPSEHDEQVDVVEWFRATYPGTLIFAIPNGGTRDKREAVRLRDEGVLAGVPDLFIPSLGLFVEMKRREHGKVSKAQIDVMAKLREDGYEAVVCYGGADAKAVIKQRISPD